MISIQNLSKSYQDRLLFNDLSFNVGRQERIGLIGRNGHGKSTLLRIITGQEVADEGEVVLPRDYRVGFLTQHLNFVQPTVLMEAALGLADDAECEIWRVEKILFGLGFDEAGMNRAPSEFSGGYQVRIKLAQALVQEPDLLILDEPTNFLDIISIRWLVRELAAWPGELLVVSHDRGFLDSFTTHTMGLHRGKLKKLQGQTQKYYDFVAGEEETYERQKEKQDRKRKKAEQFIRQFRSSARRANQAQSRLKQLEKMGVMDELGAVDSLEFTFPYQPIEAKQLLAAHNLVFDYQPAEERITKPMIDQVSLSIARGEKVCIIGQNGRGKTTFLKLLAGELEQESGKIRPNVNLQPSYFAQAHTADLDPEHTIEEELQQASPTSSRTQIRGIAGAMMFSGNAALKHIKVLSGGERSRVLLGKMLLTSSNLLLLDEPTHHLDLPSVEAIIQAVKHFPGGAVVITHDEHFMRQVATKLVIFEPSGIRIFEGSYQQFLNEVGWEEERNQKAEDATRKPKRRQQPELTVKEKEERQREKEQQKKVRQLEKNITTLEEQYAALNEQLVTASLDQDLEAIHQLSQQLKQRRSEIDFLYLELQEHLG